MFVLIQPFEVFLYSIFGLFLLIGITTISLYIIEYYHKKTTPKQSIHLMIGVVLLLIGGAIIIDLL